MEITRQYRVLAAGFAVSCIVALFFLFASGGVSLAQRRSTDFFRQGHFPVWQRDRSPQISLRPRARKPKPRADSIISSQKAPP